MAGLQSSDNGDGIRRAQLAQYAENASRTAVYTGTKEELLDAGVAEPDWFNGIGEVFRSDGARRRSRRLVSGAHGVSLILRARGDFMLCTWRNDDGDGRARRPPVDGRELDDQVRREARSAFDTAALSLIAAFNLADCPSRSYAFDAPVRAHARRLLDELMELSRGAKPRPSASRLAQVDSTFQTFLGSVLDGAARPPRNPKSRRSARKGQA